MECEHNYPLMRPHSHMRTVNGSYVKFITEGGRSKEKSDYDGR
jgi:hypothetical protein